MKKLLIISALTVIGANANASALKCQAVSGGKGELILTTDLSKNTASIIQKKENGHDWEVVWAKAKANMAPDGGPLSIKGSDDSPVDWSKEKGCYVWRGASMSIRLDLHNGGAKGQLQIYPNMIVQPNVRCNVPRPMLPQPQQLVCTDI